MSTLSSRVAGVASWVGRCAGAAAIGALAGGVVEAVSADGATEIIGTIGYASIIAWPVLTLAVMIVRGLWWAWRPGEVVQPLIEDHGSAPRLLAWIVYILIGCFVLSWATFNAVHQLSRITTFKPPVIGLAMPPVVIVVALILVATSRPAVDLIASLARRLDRRVHARWSRTVLRPRTILIGGAVALAGGTVFAWFHSVAPRIGYLDLEIFRHPAVAIVTAAVAQQVVRRLSRRPARITLAAAAIAVVGTIGFALWMRSARPLAVLQIWGRPTVAAEVIEDLYYLEDLREDIAFLVSRPAAKPGVEPRDVILITIDTVRVDHTPLGGGRAEMPQLAALGTRGAVFMAAFSPGNVTRRSIPSIATGVSPTRMHGKVAGWALRLDPRHVLLAERFRAAGYDTAGFFCCNSFWGPQHRLGINRGIDHLYIEKDGAVLAEAARAWLVERRGKTRKPLFVWIHFIEPHNWLEGRTDLHSPGERRGQYDHVLNEVDGDLGKVLEAFAQPGDQDRVPIIAVTADHGEGLGDHGAPFHSTDLYDSQIHVPLVIAGPGIPPHRIVEPIGTVGLAPTLLDLAGFVPPGMPQMDGTSFADLVTGTRTGDPEAGYAFSAMIHDRSAAAGMRAVVKGRWKLIETDKGLELYNRTTDPGEAVNQVKANPGKVAELKQLLDARAPIDGRSPFDSP